jgi:hypothetical protein
MNFCKIHFNAVHRVYDLAEHEDCSISLKRLLSYVHFKTPKHFFINDGTDKRAIEIMLDSSIMIADELAIIPQFSDKIKWLDEDLCEVFGMEYRLQSELQNRLRMYTDKKFRDSVLKIYETSILPFITQGEL